MANVLASASKLSLFQLVEMGHFSSLWIRVVIVAPLTSLISMAVPFFVNAGIVSQIAEHSHHHVKASSLNPVQASLPLSALIFHELTDKPVVIMPNNSASVGKSCIINPPPCAAVIPPLNTAYYGPDRVLFERRSKEHRGNYSSIPRMTVGCGFSHL